MQTYTHLSYSFNKTTKEVTITWFSGAIEQIKLITDLTTTTPTVIYDPTRNGYGWTLAGSVLTLTYNTNTASFANTDKLEIIIDPAVTTQPISWTVTANLAAGTNNIGDVDVLTVGWVTPAFGSGVRWASVQRVTIATDDTITVASHAVTNLSQLWGQAISMGTGVRDAGTQRVTIATNDVVPITDNSGSLTVDAPVWTPVFVRLSDGSSAIATLPVSIAATVVTKETRSSHPSQTSPSVTTSSTSILASNANRLGATIYNEAWSTCLVELWATASATSYTVQIAVWWYYEVPFNYTWAIDWIVASGTATLRVTELT